ncbi:MULTISPECIES: TolC family outer membrane protein [unclassified Sphingomonas]|uniref:TolC family outer membrane protein n=1 Tax=unclassified Sphingomonas TaxID=196159 RepID=UPI0009EABB7E|nr:MULTISPECIES: TolC family outer membrane protein [unclassified Sphingomonas]
MHRFVALAACVATVLPASVAHAQDAPPAADSGPVTTLRAALRHAYRTNPGLTAARAGLRAIDEGVPIAKAAARPTLSATADYQEYVLTSANSLSAPTRAFAANGNLSFPLFQGGRVANSIRAADARVESGRSNLRATEADVFNAIVSVYMDVLRDEAIVQLNTRNVTVLATNLQASRDRFEVGDLTRTDVAQSEARLSLARGQLQAAQAQLIASRENYIRFVGLVPGQLAYPAPLPGLPGSAEQATAIALGGNPLLDAARTDAQAAGYDVRVARAARLPRLSAVGSSGYNNYLGSLTSSLPGRTFLQSQTSATIGLSATIPLYQGGLPGAQVRRAQALHGQSLEQVTLVERRIVAEVRAAFARHRAALELIRSAEDAVAANTLAVEGVRAELTVGTRNVLDVLNAEQELLNARVQLVTARRDAYVAAFGLLVAMGQAEAHDLGLFSSGGKSSHDEPLRSAASPSTVDGGVPRMALPNSLTQ